MGETDPKPIQKTDEEVINILKESVDKGVGSRRGDQTPIVPVEIIVENIETKGKVWEKKKKPNEKKKKSK